MNDQILTPEKSFDIINQAIKEARTRVEENGPIYTLWGLLSTLAALGQFYLLKNGQFTINYYPYFLMPLGAIYTAYYFYRKKRKGPQNHIGKIIGISLTIVTLNVFVLSFLLAGILKTQLIPILLILLGTGTIISAGATRNKLILFSGIILNLSGLACFYVEWMYQPLLLGIVSTVAIFIPGIILMVEQKKKENV